MYFDIFHGFCTFILRKSAPRYASFDEWGRRFGVYAGPSAPSPASISHALASAGLAGASFPSYWDCACKTEAYGGGGGGCEGQRTHSCSASLMDSKTRLTVTGQTAWARQSGTSGEVAFCHLQCSKKPDVSAWPDYFTKLSHAKRRLVVEDLVAAPHICVEVDHGVWIPKGNFSCNIPPSVPWMDSVHKQKIFTGEDRTTKKLGWGPSKKFNGFTATPIRKNKHNGWRER